jgi:hypothetical protein
MGSFIKGLFTAIGALATLLGAVAFLLYAAGFVQIHPGPIGIQVLTRDSKIDIKDDSKQEVKASAPTLTLPNTHATPAAIQTQPTPAPSPAPQTSANGKTDQSSPRDNRTEIAETAPVQTKGRAARQSRARHVYTYPNESEIQPAYTYEPSDDSCTCPTVTADASASSSEDNSQNTESTQQYRDGNTIVTRRVVRRVYHYRYPN